MLHKLYFLELTLFLSARVICLGAQLIPTIQLFYNNVGGGD